MELTELSKLLKAQNESGKGFQIHINSGYLMKNLRKIWSFTPIRAYLQIR